MKILRRLVSKKKKRYEDPENGFDLDLAYITPNIIAMGYPSPNFEKIYRNPMEEVQRFLETKHKNKYKLWNLCAERAYDKTCFHGRVEDSYQFYDHEAPKFEILIPFCKNVHEWLSQDPENVAVIHCKAGKGRTGVCISCYLMYAQLQQNAKASLDFYGKARTKNRKGVTIPSQRRYVHYLEQAFIENTKRRLSSIEVVETKSSDSIQSNNGDNVVVENDNNVKKEHCAEPSSSDVDSPGVSTPTNVPPPVQPQTIEVESKKKSYIDTMTKLEDADIVYPNATPSLRLKSISITPAPVVAGIINFEVLNGDFEAVYDHKDYERNGVNYKTTDASVTVNINVPVNGDAKIVVKKKKRGKFVKFFHFWINTNFIEKDPQDDDLFRVSFQKPELDKIYRDTKHKKLPEGCKVELTFSRNTDPRTSE